MLGELDHDDVHDYLCAMMNEALQSEHFFVIIGNKDAMTYHSEMATEDVMSSVEGIWQI